MKILRRVCSVCSKTYGCKTHLKSTDCNDCEKDECDVPEDAPLTHGLCQPDEDKLFEELDVKVSKE